uniref:Protein P n=2 Tax=Cacopsylla melanoneura TaxID=428564 RepID=A0A8D9B996_9HEMI
MDLQIQMMLEQQILIKNPFDSGFLSPIFLVPKGDGSQRPIFNLKRLNQFLGLKKFHLMNHLRLPDFLQRGDFLVKIDLSQAYCHVPIRPSHQRFLSLAYRDNIYCMTCLPFGLASAPQIFAKLTNWVAGYLRSLGLRVVVYLDDFLLVNQDSECLQAQAQVAVQTLQLLGWTVNFEKSQLSPTQCCQYLGIVWNPSTDLKFLPLEKQMVIHRYLLSVLQSRHWSWRIAKVIMGYLSFAGFVIPLGKLHYRQIQWGSRRLSRSQPHRLVAIPKLALSQIQWWTSALHRSSPIFPRSPQVFVTSDASDVGWGVVVNDRMHKDFWTDAQKEWHINLKELFAVRRALELNVPLLQNKVVLVQSDNRTVIAYIHREGGTKSLRLLQEVEALFSVAVTHNMVLIARFIPGRYNTWADNLSRQKCLPDWHLLPGATSEIFRHWGVPEIDLFATVNSAVVPQYVALSAQDHQAQFVDAFSQTWNFALAWIFPPPPLLPRVLHHLNSARGLFILIAPCWENVFWRPDLEARAVAPPMYVKKLKENLIDLSSGRPPPEVSSLSLQAWLVRGGSLKPVDRIRHI